jgi:hypothetical protein
MDQAASRYSDNRDYASTIPILKEAITPSYVQRKIETFLDDLDSWITNKTQTPPSISFNDLREEVLNLPQYRQQVKQINDFIQVQKTSTQQTSTTDPSQAINSDINDLLGKNLTFNVGSRFDWMKKVYQYYDLTLAIFAILSVLCIVGIIGLSVGLKSKLRSTAWALLLTALLTILPMMLTTNIGDLVAKQIAVQYPAFPPTLITFFERLLNALANASVMVNRAAFGLFAFISIVCFVWSYFIKQPVTSTETKTTEIDKTSLQDPVSPKPSSENNPLTDPPLIPKST